MQIERMLVLRLYKSSLCAEIQRKYDLRFKTLTSSEFPGRDKNCAVTSQEVLSSKLSSLCSLTLSYLKSRDYFEICGTRGINEKRAVFEHKTKEIMKKSSIDV